MDILYYPEIYRKLKAQTKKQPFKKKKKYYIYVCKYNDNIKYFTKHNAYFESITVNNIFPCATRSQEKDEPGEAGGALNNLSFKFNKKQVAVNHTKILKTLSGCRIDLTLVVLFR